MHEVFNALCIDYDNYLGECVGGARPVLEFPPVLSKKDFVIRYAKGEFGNASPTWLDVDSFIAWGCEEFGSGPSHGLFHLRNGAEAGGITYYKLHWSEAVARWCEQPYKQNWYCSMQVPNEVERTLQLQGEVMQHPHAAGLYLLYTRVAKPMRDALREHSAEACGIMANSLLKDAMCWNSYEWLMVLLERYPQHVVEFSSFGRKWGTLPGFNTIVWEVRKY